MLRRESSGFRVRLALTLCVATGVSLAPPLAAAASVSEGQPAAMAGASRASTTSRDRTAAGNAAPSGAALLRINSAADPAVLAQDTHPTKAHATDTKFRPRKDGFGFANWRGLTDEDRLSSKNLESLFGPDGACTPGADDETCVLRSGYALTLNQLNQYLSQGRCEGMVVLSALVYMKKVMLRSLGTDAKRTFDVSRAESADDIAYWWGTQLSPHLTEYASHKRLLNSDTLAHEMFWKLHNKTLFTIGLYDGDVAHAVLPYRATWKGHFTRFDVYDPNFPGESRSLVIDHKKMAWTYARAILADGTTGSLTGVVSGGLDYLPVNMRLGNLGWEHLGLQ